MCMYTCISMKDLGGRGLEGAGGMLPHEIFRNYALRLLLRPFWDRISAVVAWLVECTASNFCLSTYAFTMPADLEFPTREGAKVTVTEQQVG